MTKYGRPWAENGYSTAVTHEFRKLLQDQNLHRRGIGFYTLRHVFRTVADATHDVPAIRLVMGHVDGSIDDVRIDDGRLVVVSEHLRHWLFGKPTDAGTTGEGLGA